MIEIKTKPYLYQLFCKHEWVKARRKSLFCELGGTRIYVICEKCGKVMLSYREEGKQ